MLQNLFHTWFGTTFLFKIWRIYGECQKQSPTVTFRHQCCKQIASIVVVFVFLSLCLFLSLSTVRKVPCVNNSSAAKKLQ